jgi:DNA-binding response OmpR family regulator
MFIIIDERVIVTHGYGEGFGGEGVAAAGFSTSAFREWVDTASEPDLKAVEAFLVGESPDREYLPRVIRQRSQAPVIAMNETSSLDQTLGLFAAGVDDVVRKPVHVKELLARVGAIRRRAAAAQSHADAGALRVFFDGRDPQIDGRTLPLPRRERRILEFLMSHRGKRVSKTQIFNAIYGLFDEDIDENVVDSHMSKLRKKLRRELGHDPICSKRFLGYCLL